MEVTTMKSYFMNSVLRSCYKKNLKSDFLEKKLDEAICLVEKSDIQLNNILCSAKINPKEVESASRNVEVIIYYSFLKFIDVIFQQSHNSISCIMKRYIMLKTIASYKSDLKSDSYNLFKL